MIAILTSPLLPRARSGYGAQLAFGGEHPPGTSFLGAELIDFFAQRGRVKNYTLAVCALPPAAAGAAGAMAVG